MITGFSLYGWVGGFLEMYEKNDTRNTILSFAPLDDCGECLLFSLSVLHGGEAMLVS